MATFISILRGINVGGKGQIKMEELRKTYARLGFGDVATYIQSGNVIFTSAEEDVSVLEHKISEQFEADFGYRAPVIVLSGERLARIVRSNPFTGDPAKDQAFLHVTFLERLPDPFDKSAIEEKKAGDEEIHFDGTVVYLYCPHGYGTTKLNNNLIERKLKVGATTRNWKTTLELLRLSGVK